MDIDRRALYNSLRMNWLLNNDMEVEPWQVEDYRSLSSESLFKRLNLYNIHLDKSLFIAKAGHFDTPEEFTDHLLEASDEDVTTQDQIYLLIFELWRRFMPEKPCLSIFCDELDHQIYLYDSGQADSPEAIQDAIANLQVVLDENIDNGGEPVEVFESIGLGCANDLESFLYDYIAEQIDGRNASYATELLDGFYDYVQDSKWFDFLKARLVMDNDPEAFAEMNEELVKTAIRENDLEFNFELLSSMTEAGKKELFLQLAKHTATRLAIEEDFQDLLSICEDFFHRLDQEPEEAAIQKIIKERARKSSDEKITQQDPDLLRLIKFL